jgi:cytochrome c biogenesis protein CcmG/thiol:disulfide interchange protein DsbE
MKRWILWAPLALFVLFFGVVASGLVSPSSTTIKSKMIGKPLPAFSLPAALPDRPGLSSADMARGEPRLLNFFASWCVPCIAEAPHLMELKRRGVKIEAIAIRDKPADIARFLSRWGDPYDRIASDTESRVQFDLGSSGVPESFVIDGRGIIRHQHIGDIRADDIPEILAALDKAR